MTWKTRKKGTRAQRGLRFRDSEVYHRPLKGYKKLSLSNLEQAKTDAQKLLIDFQNAKTREKKLKLKRATVSISNKAKSLGYGGIASVYEETYKKMHLPIKQKRMSVSEKRKILERITELTRLRDEADLRGDKEEGDSLQKDIDSMKELLKETDRPKRTSLQKLPVKVRWNPYKRDSQQRVWMTPEQFLSLSAPPMFGETKEQTFGFAESSLKGIDKAFKKGKELYSLRLDVGPDGTVKGHEGRHRAYYALMKGWKKIPVIIWHEDKEGRLKPVTKPFDVKKLKPQIWKGKTALDIVKTESKSKRATLRFRTIHGKIIKGELVAKDLKKNKAIVKVLNPLSAVKDAPKEWYLALIRIPSSRYPEKRKWFQTGSPRANKEQVMVWFRKEDTDKRKKSLLEPEKGKDLKESKAPSKREGKMPKYGPAVEPPVSTLPQYRERQRLSAEDIQEVRRLPHRTGDDFLDLIKPKKRKK